MAQGALTDDNSVWPEDRPVSALPSPSTPAPAPSDPYNGYWIPKILAGLANTIKSGATLPGDVATGKADINDPQTQARVPDMTGLVMGGGLAGPSEADMTNMGFRLYHGTPYYFEKPSTEFIGAGQGAQSYGWGLYGAQAEGVAKDMRDQLAFDPRDKIGDIIYNEGAKQGPRTRSIADIMSKTRGLEQFASDPRITNLAETALQEMDAQGLHSPEGVRAFQQLDKILPPPSKGHMQEWEVNADPSHFLDWNATVGDQSQHVTDALQRANFWPYLDEHLNERFTYNNPTGQDIYRWFTEDMDPSEASNELLKAGIPGIKTLDQRSRMNAKTYGLSENDPQMTRNFVIPDENMIKVVRHYNAAGVPGLLGQMAAPQTQGQ